MEPNRGTSLERWWGHRSVRVVVWLVWLCLIVAWVGGRLSVLDALGLGGGGSTEKAVSWCIPRSLPTAAIVGPGELLDLRAGVSAVTPEDGRRYASGVALPEDMWSDGGPTTLNASRMAGGRWPAGYELRWWTRDYDTVADVVMFSNARQAGEFFQEAAGTRCRRAGRSYSTVFAPQARDLTWTNPDSVKQSDTFLLRGRRVYRIAAVSLVDATPVGQRADLAFTEALACRLPGAGCGKASTVAGRSPL
jgi:hypothetical protein